MDNRREHVGSEYGVAIQKNIQSLNLREGIERGSK